MNPIWHFQTQIALSRVYVCNFAFFENIRFGLFYLQNTSQKTYNSVKFVLLFTGDGRDNSGQLFAVLPDVPGGRQERAVPEHFQHQAGGKWNNFAAGAGEDDGDKS